MTISGRVILGDHLRIDNAIVLALDGCGEDEGEFRLAYVSHCDACSANGYLHGRRCAWCLPHPGEGYVTTTIVSLPDGDLDALFAWASRQQFDTTAEGNDVIAAQLLDGIRQYREWLTGAATERSAVAA